MAENPAPLILVVDDVPDNLELMSNLLTGYRLKVANNGERGLRLAMAQPQPDLILLDLMMPGIDGYEVCRRLKADAATRHIPVIFLTAKAEIEDEQTGLELGAVDYITKPISPPIVLARVKTHLQLKQMSDFLRDKNAFLETEVQRRTRDLLKMQDATIQVVAALAETRDNETGNHIRRTQSYVKRLAEAVRGHPRFSADLTDETIELLFKSAPLHDIGKVGIPDAILLKPGKLTPEEFEIMKTHAAIGASTLEEAEDMTAGGERSFLRFAREIAGGHHEKWDGTGYPGGLAGDAIPLSARLMALADVYDALISKRVYKPAFSHEEAVGLILKGRGTQFDPDLIEAFTRIEGEFRAIAASLSD